MCARRAVERNLESVGEAMSHILDRDESIVLTCARNITKTRNRIIHGYVAVPDEILWGIVIKRYRF